MFNLSFYAWKLSDVFARTGSTCYAHAHARAVRCPGGVGSGGEFWLWQLPSTAHCSEGYCTTLAE